MEIKLKTPLSDEVTELKAGDIVYITGKIFTARDRAHKRIIERGAPFDIEGSVIFHAGPIIRFEEEPDTSAESITEPPARLVVVGPTTSGRMNPFQPEVIEMGVRAVIGKGEWMIEPGMPSEKKALFTLQPWGLCGTLWLGS